MNVKMYINFFIFENLYSFQFINNINKLLFTHKALYTFITVLGQSSKIDITDQRYNHV